MSKKLTLFFIFSLLSYHQIDSNFKNQFIQGLSWGAGSTCALLGVSAIAVTSAQKWHDFQQQYIFPPQTPYEKASTQINNAWLAVPEEVKRTMAQITIFTICVLISIKLQQYIKEMNTIFTIHPAGTIEENFNSVAGNEEVKDEVLDIISYLKDPTSFKKLGATIPKGMLLTGPPGTGKTLLARALAGEANCSFISCSGSDFVEMYVGVGASRVRELFNTARSNQPCIIFIDEIDALAKHRSGSSDGGSSEYNQTVNQLLSEMDGFAKSNQPVIVIGATNHSKNLDPAVLRPGRFDRTLKVELPDVKSRKAILQVHLKKITHDPELNIDKIAKVTPGFSGADLANLVNEAAIIATKKELSAVTIFEFEEAKDKVTLGKKHKSLKMTDQEKKCTAYHEAGHALVGLLSPNSTKALNKITILPQGNTLGTTHYLPEQELHSMNKEQILAEINIALGGRAAEELLLSHIATGASSDFEKASKLARSMICNYGMTDIIGKQVIIPNKPYSEETLKKVDQGVSTILEHQYKEVINLLNEHKDKLELLAQTLLAKETLYAAEVYKLLGIPPRKTFQIT